MWTNEQALINGWVSDGGLGSDLFGETLWGESTSSERWTLETVNQVVWS